MVTFGGSDLVGVDRFECSPDGAAFAACASPVTLNGLGAGSHTFAVKAIDTSDNTDGTPATFSWNVVVIAAPEGLDVTVTTDASGNTVIAAADETTGEAIVQVTLPPGSEIPSGRIDLDVVARLDHRRGVELLDDRGASRDEGGKHALQVQILIIAFFGQLGAVKIRQLRHVLAQDPRDPQPVAIVIDVAQMTDLLEQGELRARRARPPARGEV